MAARSSQWLSFVSRFLRSWYLPAGILVLIVIAVLIWALPRRYESVISAESDLRWDASNAPPRRSVLWEPPASLSKLLPGKKGSFIAPRLTNSGTTLYFTFREEEGKQKEDADIYRSELVEGKWQTAQPVAELNTDSDDICSSLTADGQYLYLYSNRVQFKNKILVERYDIFESRRTKDGWSKPRHLGSKINSPVKDYDPTVSPDGLTLVFASNRNLEAMEKKDKDHEWTGTLRAQLGLTHFDLYICKRHSLKEDWSDPEPISELNAPQYSEGAPYFSPSGRFLYFTSNRPEREGEPLNYDLYRAHLVNGSFEKVRNLGSEINTSKNEMEPSLSPEGFTIYFSSDRDGSYQLYYSKAEEVYALTEWDSSRWQVIATWWWIVLASLLSILLLAFLLWYLRIWLFQKATASRFLVASLLLHLLVLMILGLIPVAHSIIEQVTALSVAPEFAQIFDESTNNAQPSYEKLAEPDQIAEASMPQVARQVTTPPKLMPKKVTQTAATIPVHARPLPVPAPVQAKQPPLPPQPAPPIPNLSKQTRLNPLTLAHAKPLDIELPKQVQKPEFKPIDEGRVEFGQKTPTDTPPVKKQMPSPVPAKIKSEKPTTVNLTPSGTVDAKTMSKPEQVPTPKFTKRPTELVQAAPVKQQIKIDLPDPQEQPKDEPVRGALLPLEKKNTQNTQPEKVKSQSLIPAPKTKLPVGKQLTTPLPAKIAANPPNTVVAPLPALEKPSPNQLKVAANVPLVDPGMIPLAGGKVPEFKALQSPAISVDRHKSEEFNELPATPIFDPKAKLKLPFPPPIQMAQAELTQGGNQPRLNPMAQKAPKRKLADGEQIAAADVKLPPITFFKLRDKNTRKDAVKIFGGTKESEEAVELGLKWLAAHQSEDGSWSLNQFHRNCKHPRCNGRGSVHSDTAGTALALLPFLGAGYTHQTGKYQDTVDRGLKWLLEHQRKDGNLLPNGHSQTMYSHGLASIALCEALGMTRDPTLKEPAQKALDFIARAQHQPTGGWRYNPNQSGDTSVFGWQVMALKSGQMAGLKVSPNVFRGAQRWLKRVEGNRPIGGMFGYTNNSPRVAMTAQGLLSLQLMGIEKDDPRLLAGADYLLKHLPRPGRETSYYWYHATQVMYHMQGDYWKIWNEKIRDLHIRTQITKGSMAGSWNPTDNWERSGGRIFSTSLRLLMLEVYYRHLPLYQQLNHP